MQLLQRVDELLLFSDTQDLEPHLLMLMHEWSKFIGNSPPRFGQLDQNSAPVGRMWQPSHIPPSFQRVNQTRYARATDDQVFGENVRRQRLGRIRQQAQHQTRTARRRSRMLS